jgi:tRNA pseudouridine38-40 synthase
MPRFKLTLEYEGTRYRGWQIQKNARTVQGEIERAVREALKLTTFEFQGAGRTDAGVHAIAQVAHLDADLTLQPGEMRDRLNDVLPPDINVLSVAHAHPRFHARHHARARSYLYQIARRRTALAKRFVWWIDNPLNVNAMREAASCFVGMKDFRSFTRDNPGEKSTLMFVSEFILHEAGNLILVRVTGSHFLWNSVRRMVGSLVQVGRGNIPPGDLQKLLVTDSDAMGKHTAPPSGLFLEHIHYDGDPPLHPVRPVFPLHIHL